MTVVRSAVHVRTGQRAAVAALDGWLARHEVTVAAVEDAFDACAYLVKNYEQVPDLVLVGLDGLTADEAPLIGYIRDTWPRAAIVIYGRPGEFPVPSVAPPVQMCCTTESLDRLLRQTPAQLAQEVQGRTTAWRPLSGSARDVEAWEPPVAQVPASIGPEPAGGENRLTSLTREELSALLDDPEES